MQLPYLQDLTLRLAAGATRLDATTRQRHSGWLQAQQREDGGFAGREGGSDLYYTGFALRALLILDALDEDTSAAAARFLHSRLDKQESIIDLISLIFSAGILELSAGTEVFAAAADDWDVRFAALLESLRSDDGGYAKTPEGRAGSTYQTFLTLLAYQLMGQTPPEAARIVDFLRRHEHEEGGFLEIRVGKRAGVNPTAAAIGALRTLDALTPEIAARTIDFLAEMQADEGGLTANTRIPLADLLSTCTGIITLTDLEALDAIDADRARRYARQMERETGGFAGFAMDPAQDVEYTFYGLAALALAEPQGAG